MILGYVRASDDSCPIEFQWDIIEGYARSYGVDKYGVQIFNDIGNSGATRLAFRPGGSDLISSISKGDTIVAARLDRMFRSAKDAINTLEQLKACDVDLILFDISSESIFKEPTFKLLMLVLKAVYDMEQVVFKERIAEGRRRAKQSNVSIVPP